jgi:hypothetical protein
MTALTLARTRRSGIRAMITAIALAASGHALSLFNFAAASVMSTIFFRHFHHLLSYNLLLSVSGFVLYALRLNMFAKSPSGVSRTAAFARPF